MWKNGSKLPRVITSFRCCCRLRVSHGDWLTNEGEIHGTNAATEVTLCFRSTISESVIELFDGRRYYISCLSKKIHWHLELLDGRLGYISCLSKKIHWHLQVKSYDFVRTRTVCI